jgi:hypothetical protein
MAAMGNPEVMAEMTKMMKDPSFQAQLAGMAKDPSFKNYVSAVSFSSLYHNDLAIDVLTDSFSTDGRHDARPSEKEKDGEGTGRHAGAVVRRELLCAPPVRSCGKSFKPKCNDMNSIGTLRSFLVNTRRSRTTKNMLLKSRPGSRDFQSVTDYLYASFTNENSSVFSSCCP